MNIMLNSVFLWLICVGKIGPINKDWHFGNTYIRQLFLLSLEIIIRRHNLALEFKWCSASRRKEKTMLLQTISHINNIHPYKYIIEVIAMMILFLS